MKRVISAVLMLMLLLCGCEARPVPMPTILPDILDHKVAFDEFGAFYDTGVELPDMISEPDLYALEEDLLLLSMEHTDAEHCRLVLTRISRETGQVLCTAVVDARGYGTVQVFEDAVCLSSPPSGKLWIYSTALEPVEEISFAPNYNNWYVSPDLKHLYQFGWDAGLICYSVDSGVAEELLPAHSSVSVAHPTDRGVAFIYMDPQSQMIHEAELDLTTGQIRNDPYAGGYANYTRQGELWLANAVNNEMRYFLGRGDAPLHTFVCMDAYATLTRRGEILIRNYVNGRVTLYDAEGRFLSQLQLPMGQYGPSGYLSEKMVWDEARGGYFVILSVFSNEETSESEPTQTTDLMFWDLRSGQTGEDLALSDYGPSQPGGTSADRSLYDRAQSIGQRYGVTVLIADQCESAYENFETYTVSDTVAITTGLDELEEALSKYPEGFFDQLRYATVQRLEFSLTGTLTPLREDETGVVTAFAQPLNGKYIIVADAFTVTDTTFHHELSHVIDHRLAWDAEHSENALFSEEAWATMNPKDFDYDWTYALHHDRWDYDDDYFMTSYSCTYPTEDRATVWEQAMVGNDYPFGSGPMREKLEYYCACIRDCFDTAGWPEILPWEQVLRKD